MKWQNTETPTFRGSDNDAAAGPDVVETMQLLDRDGNVAATFTKQIDGAFVLSGPTLRFGDGTTQSTAAGAYDIADESPADGMNDTFTFSGPPKLIFTDGVMERRKGTVVGNTFVYDAPPTAGADVEGLV